MKVHAARLAGMSRTARTLRPVDPPGRGDSTPAARYGYEQFSGDNNEYGMAAA